MQTSTCVHSKFMFLHLCCILTRSPNLSPAPQSHPHPSRIYNPVFVHAVHVQGSCATCVSVMVAWSGLHITTNVKLKVAVVAPSYCIVAAVMLAFTPSVCTYTGGWILTGSLPLGATIAMMNGKRGKDWRLSLVLHGPPLPSGTTLRNAVAVLLQHAANEQSENEME